MKNYMKILLGALIIISGMSAANAQTTQAAKKAAKIAEIKDLINNRNYIFNATYVNPLRGGGRALTSSYDVTVKKDTVIAYLPFFGQATMADYGSTDGGINFTSTHFTYTVTNKKSGWDIVIKFTNGNIGNPKDVRQFLFNISDNGYANLQVLSSNRDAISFNGDIRAIKKNKP